MDDPLLIAWRCLRVLDLLEVGLVILLVLLRPIKPLQHLSEADAVSLVRPEHQPDQLAVRPLQINGCSPVDILILERESLEQQLVKHHAQGIDLALVGAGLAL